MNIVPTIKLSTILTPVPYIFGGHGGSSGDPTLLNDELLETLGLTYTRTGVLHDLYDQQPEPGRYRRRAANEPVYVPSTVEGKVYPSLLMEGAATPLVSHSADATNAAWTKNNVAATLGHGDLTGSATFSSELWGTAAIVLTGSTNKWVDNGNGTYTKAAGATRNVESDFLSVSDLAWIEFTLSGVTGGTLTVNVGGTVVGSYTQNGTYSVGYQAGANGFVRFIGDSSFAGTLGGISVKTFDKFHSLLTATGANALLSRTVTRASAARQARIRIRNPATSSGSIFVSHGKPTGSELAAFGAGWNANNAVSWSWDGAKWVSSGSGSDTLNKSFSTVVGRLYRVVVASSSIAGGSFSIRVGTSLNGSQYVADVDAIGVTKVLYFTATTTTAWISIVTSAATGNVTASTAYEVEELEIEPGEYVDIALDEYTGANPFFAVRIPTDDDTAELYDFQGFELTAGTPPPRTVPQGATPAAVGAGACLKTLGVAPDAADVDLLIAVPSVNGARALVAGTSANRLVDIHRSATDIRLYGSNTSVGSYTLDRAYGSIGDIVLVKARASAGTNNASLTLDNGTPSAATPSQAIPAVTSLALGHFPAPQNHLDAPIIAIRDNNGQLFQQIESYGPELVTNGGPFTDTAGWTALNGAALSVVDGKLRVTGNGVNIFPKTSFAFTAEIGSVYEVSYTFEPVVDNGHFMNWQSAEVTIKNGVNGPISVTQLLRHATGTGLIALMPSNSSTGVGDFSGISIRKVNFRQNVGFNLRAMEAYEASL